MQYNKYEGANYYTIKRSKSKIGDLINIECQMGNYIGTLMPRYQYTNHDNIIIKLQNGYNVGIPIESVKKITKMSRQTKSDVVKQVYNLDSTLPKILLLSTGGTIASSLDYITGAVSPKFDGNEIQKLIPEISKLANVDTEVIFLESSENIMPSHWKNIAKKIITYKNHQYAGIIISHGTDTMHYTSAYLSFALSGFPIPVVIVGSQRSLDRPSSDAAINLISTIKFIIEYKSQGIFVAMHEDENDNVVACHIGTRVRKNHTSKRGAFQTVGDKPAFLVHNNGDGHVTKNTNEVFNKKFYGDKIDLDPRVALIKYYPGYDSKLFEYIIDHDYRAIIFEGTGLGHVGNILYENIKKANEKNIFVGMTTQCINGIIQMNVYESGRKLTKLGVIPLNMIPETAVVKAMWALGNSKNSLEMKKLMLKNIAFEFK